MHSVIGLMKRRVVLLGATGSIGESTLEVIRGCAAHFELVGIAAYQKVGKLAEIAKTFNVKHVAIGDEAAWKQAKSQGLFDKDVALHSGAEGLEALAVLAEADIIVVATVGTHGLRPTLAALQAGKQVALANKEVLVMAGEWVMAEVKKQGHPILPLDSEHNALFQCIKNEPDRAIKKLILTASGGPFRTLTTEAMKQVTPEMALQHPNWQMGPKVTLDCATMANKGLELIEAHWLFDMPEDRIEVIIHPQSIVHSMVEFVDGSTLAHLSPPKMTFAIQNSLMYPERAQAVLEPLNFSQGLHLTFEAPDVNRFPCLRLAREALIAGGAHPAVFNAANEIAVQAFIEKRLSFVGIPLIIEKTLAHSWAKPEKIKDILWADAAARRLAEGHIMTSQSSTF